MLHKATTLKDYQLQGLDGEIGKLKEFYFDDHHWTIRYLAADTEKWLKGRKVLISPCALAAVNAEEQSMTVDLTRKQIEDSPFLDQDKPLSRKFEEEYCGFYGWPKYWTGPYRWGASPEIVHNGANQGETASRPKGGDSHLRGTHSVIGHDLQAADGRIGHVEDFVLDDETWAIRYLVIDSGLWRPGKKVLVSTGWIERVSWDQSELFVDLSREAIRQSPEYAEELPLTRDYEAALHSHYNRQAYWVDSMDVREHSR